mmetsp:Transcript_328/g.1139  ORF Transcript_328/g.1139 Transcript_328/m.1139 type:complete len:231 (-) Transcript_328:971-1663(-)
MYDKAARGTAAHANKSRSKAPGPTEGSWFGSPMNKILACFGKAAKSLEARGKSNIDASSTTTASTSNGFCAFRMKPSSREDHSKRRCKVEALAPIAAPKTAAPRAVGAASATRQRALSRRHASTTDRAVLVLPVPGPPTRTSSDSRRAASTAKRCSADKALSENAPAGGGAPASCGRNARRLETPAATAASAASSQGVRHKRPWSLNTVRIVPESTQSLKACCSASRVGT